MSTRDQDTDTQITALKKAGCKKIFQEKASGVRWERDKLMKLLDHLREGDMAVVWKLDRLPRSLRDLIMLMEKIGQRGAGFKSLTENMDTTTAGGRMMFQIIGSFAEFERELIRERTSAGLDKARRDGRVGGAPSKLKDHQRHEIINLISSGQKTPAVTRLFNVHRSTISRIVG